ncbi:MAG: Shedu anti-phage system protein SduA domain-containing protein [Allosphingosinicella sp.]
MAQQLTNEGSKRWTAALEGFSQEATRLFNRVYSWDTSVGDQQFILYHDGQKIRLKPFGLSGLYQFQEEPLSDGSLWIARGNIIQPTERFSEKSIFVLEDLINSDAKEAEFQTFFEGNPEFLLALGDYVKIHPQLILTEDDGGSLIPDFFLEKVDSGLCDICDLKRPTRELVRYQRHRERFRALVAEAVAQLSHYKNWFDDKSNRELFRGRYGLKSYRPKVVMIIGRRSAFEDDVKRLTLEAQLPDYVILKTYDDVVSSARRWRSMLTTESTGLIR